MNKILQYNTQTPENDGQKVWSVLEDADVGNDFLVRALVTQEIKPTIVKWDLMGLKSCSTSKETHFIEESAY